MTRFLFTVCCFVLCASLQAQDKNTPFSVELSIGVSLPTGSFAKKEFTFYDENTQGNALAGYDITAAIRYRITKRTGVKVFLDYSRYEADENAIGHYIETQYSNVSYSVQRNGWNLFRFMAGPSFILPTADKKIVFTMDAGAGLCKTKFPGFKYSYVSSSNNPTTGTAGAVKYSDRSLKAAFCYQAGIGMQYLLEEGFYLTGRASYFKSSPSYKVYKTNGTIGSGNTVSFTPVKTNVDISSVQAQIGIGIRF